MVAPAENYAREHETKTTKKKPNKNSMKIECKEPDRARFVRASVVSQPNVPQVTLVKSLSSHPSQPNEKIAGDKKMTANGAMFFFLSLLFVVFFSFITYTYDVRQTVHYRH